MALNARIIVVAVLFAAVHGAIWTFLQLALGLDRLLALALVTLSGMLVAAALARHWLAHPKGK